MRHLPHAIESGTAAEFAPGPLLALAHWLVPGLESLPGLPGEEEPLAQ